MELLDPAIEHVLSIDRAEARAERREIRIDSRPLGCDEKTSRLDDESARAHLLEGDAVALETIHDVEMPGLEEVPVPEAIDDEAVGFLAHGNPAHVDGAVLAHAVAVAEMLEVVDTQDEDARRAMLEVEDLIAQTESDVPAARATLVGLDVEIVDATTELSCGGRRYEGEEGSA